MAKKKSKKVYKKKDWKFPLAKKNLVIIGIGLGVILAGFILMGIGSIGNEYAKVDGTWNNVFSVAVAPILMVIGYCIIIPYAIIKYFPANKENNEQST